jgi:tRNA (cytidine56-2'-O)-methyltransferase
VATASSGSKRNPPGRAVPSVSVLRIGHRAGRDPRLTTHLALTARAFGAREMFLEPPDPALVDRLRDVTTRWGGSFKVVPVDDWKKVVRSFDGPVVHLTMYGLPLETVLPRLVRAPRLLLVVGGAKVPAELYRISTYNVAVGHQPHSEVAAAAVALERIRGLPGPRAPRGARQRVVPSARGKRVVLRRNRT